MHSTLSPSSRLLGVASAAVLLVVLAGCGRSIPSKPGTPLPPPGGGTGTLHVQAEISGSTAPAGGYVTAFTAVVEDALGAPVSGATVRMSTPDGQVLLMEAPGTVGTYSFSGSGYTPGIYSLDVISGNDEVLGAWVVAPNTHTIVSPAPGDTVTASSDVVVDWDRSDPIQEVTVQTLDYQASMPDDPGRAVIPGAANPPRNDQRVTVTRANRATVDGGVQGSEIGACFITTVEPVIVL